MNEITLGLYDTLKNTTQDFETVGYYFDIIEKTRKFLQTTGGSTIPLHMDKIKPYISYRYLHLPIRLLKIAYLKKYKLNLELIVGGSYADVNSYKDFFYNKTFAQKRSKNDSKKIKIESFKLEDSEMRKLSSPYIL